jgi:hypothetical protein
MRRGASIGTANQDQKKRYPVAADYTGGNGADDDLEGGGGSIPVSFTSPPRSGSSVNNNSNNSTNGLLDVNNVVDSQGKGPRRKGKISVSRHANHFFTRASTDNLKYYVLALFIATCILCPLLPSMEWSILTLVLAACCFGLIASLWLSRNVLSSDKGTAEMRAVSDPIREGAE